MDGLPHSSRRLWVYVATWRRLFTHHSAVVTAGWAWGNSHEGHLERVKEHLDAGQKLLQSEHRHTTYSVPDITPDTSVPQREPPAQGDK